MIYERIEKLCKERGISVRKLEGECSLSNGSVAKWKTSSPSVESLGKVAQFFGVSIDELVRNESA